MMKNIRQAESVVNCNIAVAIAIAKGIVLANDRNLLKNGGRLNLDLKAKQSNSKAVCVWRFSEIDGFLYSSVIKEVIDAYDIPVDLVINIDENTSAIYFTEQIDDG